MTAVILKSDQADQEAEKEDIDQATASRRTKPPPSDAKDPNGAKAPGKPGAEEGFKDPEDGEKWAQTDNGEWGWLDEEGRIWVPSGPNGHGGPHWDRQNPDGTGHKNVYPGGRER